MEKGLVFYIAMILNVSSILFGIYVVFKYRKLIFNRNECKCFKGDFERILFTYNHISGSRINWEFYNNCVLFAIHPKR